MNLNDRNLDSVVSRIYRAAAELPSPADAALLRNASIALLRAQTAESISTAVDITDAVILQLGHEALLNPITVRALRQSLSTLFIAAEFEPVVAH